MARSDFKMKGVREFMRNLNKEIQALEGRTHRGLIEAAIVLMREIEPETPLDLGNLRASFFVASVSDVRSPARDTFKGSEAGKMKSDHSKITRRAQGLAKMISRQHRPMVIFGYSANYAVYVHENVDADFKRPGAKARWLYAGMQRARGKMLAKIKEYAEF